MATTSQEELRNCYFSFCTKDLKGLVLELGIGTGVRNTDYGSGATVVGVDISMERLKRRNTLTNRTMEKIVATDGHMLPFPKGIFDAIVVSFTLCSVRNVGQVMDELSRVTKPGAQIVILEHVRSMETMIGRIEDMISPIYALLSNNCHLNRNPLKNLSHSGFYIDESRVSADLVIPWLFVLGRRGK